MSFDDVIIFSHSIISINLNYGKKKGCIQSNNHIKILEQGLSIDDPVPEKFSAAKYSSGKVGFLLYKAFLIPSYFSYF